MKQQGRLVTTQMIPALWQLHLSRKRRVMKTDHQRQAAVMHPRSQTSVAGMSLE